MQRKAGLSMRLTGYIDHGAATDIGCGEGGSVSETGTRETASHEDSLDIGFELVLWEVGVEPMEFIDGEGDVLRGYGSDTYLGVRARHQSFFVETGDESLHYSQIGTG